MKYMSFNSSCSYAGIANLLERNGIQVEDRDIALSMNLPYLFHFDEKTREYKSGPMLQTKEWFDLYLNPIGFELNETWLSKNTVLQKLEAESMFPLFIAPGKKHAVVLLEKSPDSWTILNNKWEQSEEPVMFEFNNEEFLDRLETRFPTARLSRIVPREVNWQPIFQRSLQTLERYYSDLSVCMSREMTRNERLAVRDTLLRALLLDGVSMAELLGNGELASHLKELQQHYIQTLRREDTFQLREYLSQDELKQAFYLYRKLISRKLKESQA